LLGGGGCLSEGDLAAISCVVVGKYGARRAGCQVTTLRRATMRVNFIVRDRFADENTAVSYQRECPAVPSVGDYVELTPDGPWCDVRLVVHRVLTPGHWDAEVYGFIVSPRRVVVRHWVEPLEP
jgi:hypothetical protein